MALLKTLTVNGVTYSATSPVTTKSVTLRESSWEGGNSCYSQVVGVPGVTPYTKVDLQPSPEQLEIFYEKDLAFTTVNVSGSVTVYVIGDKPKNNYTIQVTATELEGVTAGMAIKGNTVGTTTPRANWNQTDSTKADYIRGREDLAQHISDFDKHRLDMNNPHNTTAAHVGARPDTWMPTAADVGARPATWLPTTAEIGVAPAQESASYPGCYYRTVNGASEWINPPMVAGVEYRTTERWNGKPVYKQLLGAGSLPSTGHVHFNISASGTIDFIISAKGCALDNRVFPSSVIGGLDIMKVDLETSTSGVDVYVTSDFLGGLQFYVTVEYTLM